jgi:Putative methyltransferase
MTRDWWEWHRDYDDPSSALSARLSIVQKRLREAIDRCPPGNIQILSLCAGQGRDVIEVVANHPRQVDVSARLIEYDHRNVEAARQSVSVLGLSGIEVVEADAGTTRAFAGAVPAGIVLACGVFGNITDADVRHTVLECPCLCARGASVIWTRHCKDPDLTPMIRKWFEEAGFEEVSFDNPDGTHFGVGVNRLTGEPRPLEPDRRLFTFVGYDQLLEGSQS